MKKEKMEDLSKYPKVLSTREDYEFVRNNFPRKYWVEDFKTLLTDSFFTVPYAPVIVKKNFTETANGENPRVFVRGLKNGYDFSSIRRDAKLREEYRKLVAMVQREANEAELYIDSNNTGEINGCKVYPGEDIQIFSNGKAYVCRTKEKPDSKLKRLGYTSDEILDYIVGISEKDLEEKKKELEKRTEEAVDRILMDAGMSREELENENIASTEDSEDDRSSVGRTVLDNCPDRASDSVPEGEEK